MSTSGVTHDGTRAVLIPSHKELKKRAKMLLSLAQATESLVSAVGFKH